MEHIKLILTLANLILGSCVVTLLFVRRRLHAGEEYLGPLALHTLCYNLLLGGALIDKYLRVNLPSLFPFMEGPVYRQGSEYLFLLLMAGMTLFQWRIRMHFLGRSAAEKRVFAVYFFLLGGLAAAAGLLWFSYPSFSDFFLEAVGDIFFLTEFTLLFLLLAGSRRRERPFKTVFIRRYSLLYLSRYPLILILVFLPESLRFYSGLGALFFFNLLPLLWTVLFSAVKSGDIGTASSNEILKGVIGACGITKREEEIIGLILAGKSNREIEELLFISPHTVKNHVYNIFRKLQISSRWELMALAGRGRAGIYLI